jgi:hypothetical protein
MAQHRRDRDDSTDTDIDTPKLEIYDEDEYGQVDETERQGRGRNP